MAGLNPAMIARALTTFETSSTQVPGRFNRLEINGVELLLDYGHNPAALEALSQAVQALEPRRTTMAITLPGDRRIDEATAIIVERGQEFRVVGSGAVYVVDGSRISYSWLSEAKPEGIVTVHDVTLHVLGEGDRFDLAERRPLRPEIRREQQREKAAT